MVRIENDEFGIVYKKFGKTLPPGRLIATNGEVGWQADVLMPGVHLKYPSLTYKIEKRKVLHIAPDEIGLVEAKDGNPLPSGRMFGKTVPCKDFEDGSAFLANGGERGNQLSILTAGTYRINPELFNVEQGSVTRIHPGQIGLVEATEGAAPRRGYSFGKHVECKNFQDAQAFIEQGGERGKQLTVLSPGSYKINTDLFRITRVPSTKIDTDNIGLVKAKDGRARPTGKKFSKTCECSNFEDGQAFFDNGGEAGFQPQVLLSGEYYINTDLFEIQQVPIIEIPYGEIGLVVAQAGLPLKPGQILGKTVECRDFQDVDAFLRNGGQAGEQMAILKAAQYQINTSFFTVITKKNAHQHGMFPESLCVQEIHSGQIGIVTTREGVSLPNGEIAGSIIEGHNKFQDGQKFLDLGGYRGLQEETLPEGPWNINPRFATFEMVPLTRIENGTVGVVISDVGKTTESTEELVESGVKGICKEPLTAGQYPINTRIKKIVSVPTHDITLDWTDRKEKQGTNYDANLHALRLSSKDGFEFKLEVTQIIRISPQNAPYMISRVVSMGTDIDDLVDRKYSSIKNLVTRVLEPVVGSFFRSAAQKFSALEFLNERPTIINDATTYINNALSEYRVTAVGTLINDVNLPQQLEEQLQEQTIEELKQATLKQKQTTEEENERLAMRQAQTQEQSRLVKAKADLQISELNFEERLKAIDLHAYETRVNQQLALDRQQGEQNLAIAGKQEDQKMFVEILRTKIKELGAAEYIRMESEQLWAEALPRIQMQVPEIFINGGAGGSTGGVEAMQMLSVQMIQSVREFLKEKDSSKQIGQPNVQGVLDSTDDVDFIE